MSRKVVLFFGVWAFLLLVAVFGVVLNVPLVGIGDTPYPIDENNQDRYPLINGIHDVAVTDVKRYCTVESLDPITEGYTTWTINISVTLENMGGFTESFTVTAYYGDTITPEQWETYWSKGDVNRDGFINDIDVDLIYAAWHSAPGDPNWNPDADLSGDDFIDVDDLKVCLWGQLLAPDIWTYFGLQPGGTIGTQKLINLPNGTSTTLTFTWNTTDVTPSNHTICANASLVLGESNTTNNYLADGAVKIKYLGDASNDDFVDVDDLQILGWTWQKNIGQSGYRAQADFSFDTLIDVDDLQILGRNWLTGY